MYIQNAYILVYHINWMLSVCIQYVHIYRILRLCHFAESYQLPKKKWIYHYIYVQRIDKNARSYAHTSRAPIHTANCVGNGLCQPVQRDSKHFDTHINTITSHTSQQHIIITAESSSFLFQCILILFYCRKPHTIKSESNTRISTIHIYIYIPTRRKKKEKIIYIQCNHNNNNIIVGIVVVCIYRILFACRLVESPLLNSNSCGSSSGTFVLSLAG